MDKKKIPFPSRVEGFLDCCGMLIISINPCTNINRYHALKIVNYFFTLLQFSTCRNFEDIIFMLYFVHLLKKKKKTNRREKQGENKIKEITHYP